VGEVVAVAGETCPDAVASGRVAAEDGVGDPADWIGMAAVSVVRQRRAL